MTDFCMSVIGHHLIDKWSKFGFWVIIRPFLKFFCLQYNFVVILAGGSLVFISSESNEVKKIFCLQLGRWHALYGASFKSLDF